MTERGNMKRRVSIPMIVFLVVMAMFLGTQFNSLISEDNIYSQIRKLQEVISLTDRYYVEEVNTSDLIEAGIKGMLGSLDPHSVYIPAKQMQRVTEEFRGSFEGIGIQFDVLRDTIHVIAPVAGGPSERVGIMSGDRIVKIDDESSIGFTNEDVMSKLRGPKGTRVVVHIVRIGFSELLEFEIIRDEIPLHSVTVSAMVDEETGYVSVNRFSATTYTEFMTSLDELRDEGMTRLILDLRSNPGGYLEEAFKMADVFLPTGKKIVYTRGRHSQFNEEYLASSGSVYEDIPLIILINPGSASASEIVAGAVQDWDRGLIVGERSFGKGLVQRQFDLRDGSAFRLTTAQYFTPSGRLIQRPYDRGNHAYRLEAYNFDDPEGEIRYDESNADTSKPVYYTEGGRIVYGGGGITPDVIVKDVKASELWVEIVRRNLFRLYNSRYMERNNGTLINAYQNDLEGYRRNFGVTDAHLDDFVSFVRQQDVEVSEEALQADKDLLKIRLKAEIAQGLFGSDAFYIAWLEADQQFKHAMELFPELKRLISAEVMR
jgi:carboxyl-terminal processing protease